MDLKIFAAVAAIGILALAGVGYANGYFGFGGAHGAPQNGSWRSMNGTHFNATAIGQFQEAMAAGDYQAAEQLHATYGFGGKMFDKLNETTFGQLSLITNLTKELRQELGFNETAPMPRPPLGPRPFGTMMHRMHQ